MQAAAQGLSLASVLNDLNSPMPNYRFYYLLQKALEVCNELKALGNAFLSAKEKGDGEALARLRATHESSIQNLVMEVQKAAGGRGAEIARRPPAKPQGPGVSYAALP